MGKNAGGSFQPDSYGSKGGAPSQRKDRALGSLSPRCPHKQEATLSPWSALPERKAGPFSRHARGLTHSIEEVSELVLLEASRQEVVGGLQYTLFEPEGEGRCFQGKAGGAPL